jgi:hypothetical protein
MKLNHKLHPSQSTSKPLTIPEIEDEVFLAAVGNGVLISRGSWFTAEREGFEAHELFFRATFAAATEEKMAEAIHRFGDAVRAWFGTTNGANGSGKVACYNQDQTPAARSRRPAQEGDGPRKRMKLIEREEEGSEA